MDSVLKQKLASDVYKAFFPGSEPVSIDSLDNFILAVAQDTATSPETVKQFLTQDFPEKLTFEEAKTVLKRRFRSPNHKKTAEPRRNQMMTDRGGKEKSKEVFDRGNGKATVLEAVKAFKFAHPDASKSDLIAFRQRMKAKVGNGKEIDWESFKECVENRTESGPTGVVAKLQQTISDYKVAISHLDPNSPQRKPIQELISTLETQLQGLSSPSSSVILQQLQTQQLKSLQLIFSFYCKQQLRTGAIATFEGYSESLSHWNMGKFIKFAIDFHLTGKHTNPDRVLSKDELKSIFMLSADERKLLDFGRFLKALNHVAEKRYDRQYDALHGTNVQAKSGTDKQALLYLDLHLEDLPTLRRTMKSWNPAFTFEKDGFRLPENDPAKRYQPHAEEHRAAVEDWKKRKEVFPSASISSLRSSAVSAQQTMARIPSDAVALKRVPPENYAEMYHMKHHPVSFTWQTLSNMMYLDVNAGDDITKEIGLTRADTGEDLLDKQYHLGKFWNSSSWKIQAVSGVPRKNATERKYDGLMKLVDEKVLRGMNTMRRLSTNLSMFSQSLLRS